MTYKIQINDEIRDATPEEIVEIEARQAEFEAIKQMEISKSAERKALLDRLGITDDEAALLLK